MAISLPYNGDTIAQLLLVVGKLFVSYCILGTQYHTVTCEAMSRLLQSFISHSLYKSCFNTYFGKITFIIMISLAFCPTKSNNFPCLLKGLASQLILDKTWEKLLFSKITHHHLITHTILLLNNINNTPCTQKNINYVSVTLGVVYTK